MPFKSKRQWRAAMGGHIPGISKEEARDWAHETKKPFKKLPDRVADEKGKATLLSKKAGDPRLPHFAKLAQMMGMAGSPASLGGLSNADGPGQPFDAPKPPQPGQGAGAAKNTTPPRPKKPGLPLRRQIANPRVRLLDAMNKGVA